MVMIFDSNGDWLGDSSDFFSLAPPPRNETIFVYLNNRTGSEVVIYDLTPGTDYGVDIEIIWLNSTTNAWESMDKPRITLRLAAALRHDSIFYS